MGDEPWKYLSLLDEGIKDLLTIGLDILLAYFQVFDAKSFVPMAVKFVFHVALPLHILRGIGIVVDFYDPKFNWNYIVAFLILRALALILVFAWIYFTSSCSYTKKGIGEVAVLWLALTWISTVILGVPVSTSLFGSETLGLFYGLLAGISSFIFQLPFQLLFLECHTLEREYLETLKMTAPIEVENAAAEAEEEGVWNSGSVSYKHPSNVEEATNEEKPREDHPTTSTERGDLHLVDEPEQVERLVFWLKFARPSDVWKKVVRKVLRNPVLWGIAGGFTLSLSKLGPRYLNPRSSKFIEGLAWFFDLTAWLGSIVSPLSLFAMGVWMQNQGKKTMFQIPLHLTVLSMMSKLILVPLVMVGLAKAMNLADRDARAAMLIASLPISMASFSLGSQYDIGQALLSENVALGTALLLPTMIIWNVVLDSIGLFPFDR